MNSTDPLCVEDYCTAPAAGHSYRCPDHTKQFLAYIRQVEERKHRGTKQSVSQEGWRFF